MKSITATEFKNKAAEILKEVSASGKSIIVTRRGKPFVKVEALNPVRPRLGVLSDRTTIVGDIVSPVFDEWNEIVSEPKAKKQIP